MTNAAIMRANFDWLKDNFSKLTNAEVANHLGISLASVNFYSYKLGLKKTHEHYSACATSRASIKSLRQRAKLEANTDWLKENYPNLSTQECAKYVGVGVNKLSAYAKELGLKKSPTYKRFFWHKLTEEQQKIIAQKRGQALKELFRAERRRVNWGFEQKTKLRVTGKFKRKTSIRYSMRKLGYHVGRAAQVAVVLPDTQRSVHYEREAHKHGITVVDENGTILNKAI